MKMRDFFPDEFTMSDAENYMLKYFKYVVITIQTLRWVNYEDISRSKIEALDRLDEDEAMIMLSYYTSARKTYYFEKFPICMRNMMEEFHKRYRSKNADNIYKFSYTVYDVICKIIDEFNPKSTAYVGDCDIDYKFDDRVAEACKSSHSLLDETIHMYYNDYPNYLKELTSCHFVN